MNDFVKANSQGLTFNRNRLIYGACSLAAVGVAAVTFATGIFWVEILDAALLSGVVVTDVKSKLGFTNNIVRSKKLKAIATQEKTTLKNKENTSKKINEQYFLLWESIEFSKAVPYSIAQEILKTLAYAFPFANKLETLSPEDAYTLESLIKDYIPGATTDYINLPSVQQKANSPASKVLLNQVSLLQEAVKNIHYHVDEEKLNALKIRNSFIIDKFAPDVMERKFDKAPEDIEDKVVYEASYWKDLQTSFTTAYSAYAQKKSDKPSLTKNDKDRQATIAGLSRSFDKSSFEDTMRGYEELTKKYGKGSQFTLNSHGEPVYTYTSVKKTSMVPPKEALARAAIEINKQRKAEELRKREAEIFQKRVLNLKDNLDRLKTLDNLKNYNKSNYNHDYHKYNNNHYNVDMFDEIYDEDDDF